MRIVLDSNVYIAAFATRGLCNDIFEYCLKNCTIFSCEEIYTEIQEKLVTKIKTPEKIAEETIRFIRAQTTVMVPEAVPQETCRDKNDLMVLGIALASKSQSLLTGDKDLLVLKKIGMTEILSPRSFWEKMMTDH